MEIAEELQREANERADSSLPEVIRLVLETIETEEELELPSVSLRSAAPLGLHAWAKGYDALPPSEYLPIFREYVCLMQEVWYARRIASFIESPDWNNRQNLYYPGDTRKEQHAKAQKKLSDKTHEARRKRRELPIHAYKRIIKIEAHFGDQLYLPVNWEPLSESIERYICRWGEGKLLPRTPNLLAEGLRSFRHTRSS